MSIPTNYGCSVLSRSSPWGSRVTTKQMKEQKQQIEEHKNHKLAVITTPMLAF
jgi:hypothetical protein